MALHGTNQAYGPTFGYESICIKRTAKCLNENKTIDDALNCAFSIIPKCGFWDNEDCR
jgi:hypothetical protein